ncbi:pyruvate-flavodoxin oxidoreductase [Cutibacterium acnes JCM 18918]|nr:pyruvate-flavodoxin oxidoreductase [Cutibacterium acnes JCM 18918]
MHFFEGFRTSHELNVLEMLSDDDIRHFITDDLVHAHRERALSPAHPFIRGTARTPIPTSKLVRPQTSTTRKCRASSSPSWTSSPRSSDANTISLSTTVILKPPRS